MVADLVGEGMFRVQVSLEILWGRFSQTLSRKLVSLIISWYFVALLYVLLAISSDNIYWVLVEYFFVLKTLLYILYCVMLMRVLYSHPVDYFGGNKGSTQVYQSSFLACSIEHWKSIPCIKLLSLYGKKRFVSYFITNTIQFYLHLNWRNVLVCVHAHCAQIFWWMCLLASNL